jgi:glycosyltransferase involved in cell wall biosynthesis
MIQMIDTNRQKVIRSLIYSNFLEHSAGIGNDMRMVFEDLKHLEIEYTLTNPKKNRFSAVYNVLRTLLLGPKRTPKIDFAYAPQVMPKLYKVPHLVRVHDIFPLTNPEWFRLKSRIYFILAMKTQMRSFFLFDSMTSKNEFVKYFGELTLNNHAVMYCKTRELSKGNFCKSCSGCVQLDILKKEHYGLAVGTIEPRKNYEYLLENWASLLQGREEKLKLYIVGSKGWKTLSVTRRLGAGVKNVVWLEKVCDSSLHELYANAALFVSASKAEGFNLPVREALSFGIPVVLSDIDVHRELYSNEALFFKLNSIHSLNEALKKALDDPLRVGLFDVKENNAKNDSKSVLRKAILKVVDQ